MVGFVTKDVYAQIGREVICKNLAVGTVIMVGYTAVSGYIFPALEHVKNYLLKEACKAVE